MTGTFIDTIIICTLTGLTLVVSGLWTGDLNGAALTQAAFLQAYPAVGNYVLMVGLVLFAFTTILAGTTTENGASSIWPGSRPLCRTASFLSSSSPVAPS